MGAILTGRAHVDALSRALERLGAHEPMIDDWGRRLAGRLDGGARLLAVGNGGSAAEAQHLTAELVGRYCDDRRPLSALALHAETSSTTAISNDYGAEEVFRRQVLAHGREGDVLVALSTSGRSPNVVAAVAAARRIGVLTWALTGPAPNPLATAADEALAVEADHACTVQEVHLVVLHMLCASLDVALGASHSLEVVS